MLETNAYAVRSLLSAPPAPPRRFTPWPDDTGVGEWTELLFSATGGPTWAGAFRRGLSRFSVIVPTPSAHHCCVIAEGQPYLVDIPNPSQTLPLPVQPVIATQHHPEILVLVSHTTLVAVLPDARWWESTRLASDGIRAVTVSSDCITGEGWQAPSEEWEPFKLDARTGQIQTGVSNRCRLP